MEIMSSQKLSKKTFNHLNIPPLKQSNIHRTFVHSHTLKMVSVFCIIWFFMVVPVFAESATKAPFQDLLTNLLQLCSRWWVVLSVLAGKLMTNDRVYGSIMHLDIYLWKIWNIMKNFANFALVAILLTSIVQNIMGKKLMSVKDMITKTLIAGVLIQASRFLVWAIVDVSTIATTAIGSFPVNFLNADAAMTSEIISSTRSLTQEKFVINMKPTTLEKWIERIPITDNSNALSTDEELMDQILPNYNSVSGPFLFLGASVFHFQNYIDSTGTDVQTMSISFLLRFVLIFFFTLGLLLLFLANIIRVVFLWLLIIWSPFMILMRLFQKENSGEKWLLKYFNFGTMLNLIFKPLIFVWWMSLILIFVVSMQSIMWWATIPSINGVTMDTAQSTSSLSISNVSSISVTETSLLGTVKDTSKNLFVNLMIFGLTLFLMREMIKLSLTSGSWPIQDVLKPVTKRVEWLATTMPLVPWWFSVKAISAAREESFKKTLAPLGMKSSGKFQANEDAFQGKVNRWMGIAQGWDGNDISQLKKVAREGWDLRWTLRSKAGDEGREWWLTLWTAMQGNILKDWLKNSKNLAQNKLNNFGVNMTVEEFLWKESKDDNTDAKQNRRAIHQLLWWDDYAKKKIGDSDISYQDLVDNVYYADKSRTK